MTKYNSAGRKKVVARSQEPHPIWRGIGCISMIMVPLISLGLAQITLAIGLDQGWPIPYPLLGNPVVPDAWWKIYSLAPVWGFIQSQTNLYALLTFAFLYALFLGSILSVAYAVLFRMFGPPQYSPLDAPPPKGFRSKRYKR